MALSDYFPFVPRPPARFVTESGAEVHGVMAEFETSAAVYHAAELVRDAGYQKWDVHTPFPIHGIEDAMGVKPTVLPLMVAVGAFTGVGLAYLMQWWMTAVDFQVVVQGKPYGAWQPFVPITFEVGVLFAAFSSLIAMLALNGLPRWNHPLMKMERFLSSSDNTFFICVEARDPLFDRAQTRRFLEGLPQVSGVYEVEH